MEMRVLLNAVLDRLPGLRLGHLTGVGRVIRLNGERAAGQASAIVTTLMVPPWARLLSGERGRHEAGDARGVPGTVGPGPGRFR